MVREDSGRICFSNDETEEEISLLLHRRQLNSVKSNGLRLSSFMRVGLHESTAWTSIHGKFLPVGLLHHTTPWFDPLHCTVKWCSPLQSAIWLSMLRLAGATSCRRDGMCDEDASSSSCSEIRPSSAGTWGSLHFFSGCKPIESPKPT